MSGQRLSEHEARARVEAQGGQYQPKLSNRSRLVYWIERGRKWAVIQATGYGDVTLSYQGECKGCG